MQDTEQSLRRLPPRRSLTLRTRSVAQRYRQDARDGALAHGPYPRAVATSGVRPAQDADAAQIARLQLSTWRTAYTSILPASVLEGLDEAAAARQWGEAIAAGGRVLVGVEGENYVGFCALAVMGRTVELGPLLVEPRWGRRGHGSRLLAAATDVAKQDGADHALIWIPEDDSVSAAFLASAGWGPDGRVRTLDTGDGLVREICLQSLLPEPG